MTGSGRVELALPEAPAPAPGGRRAQWFRAGAAIASMAVVGSIVYAMAGTLGSTADAVPFGTSDGPEALADDTLVVMQTAEKRVIQVRIRRVEVDRLAFTATVAGLPDGESGGWYAVLDNGQQLPMTVEDRGSYLFAVALEEPIPPGRTVEEVRLDPDPSEDDLFFDVR